MTARSSPTVRRRRLGNELRRLRTTARLTIEQVANQLEFSESKVSRIETGHVAALPRDISDMLSLYGVSGGQRDQLMQLAREARKKGWWHAYGGVPRSPYLGLEEAAQQISTYETMLVPGLLQTPAYARTVIRTMHPELSAEDIEQRIELREVRQRLLTQNDPPIVSAILDEAVLRRPVGSRGTVQEQLDRLIKASALPNVTVQVVPFHIGEHMGMYGPFTILRFRDPEQPDVVYLENATRESYLEAEGELRRYAATFERLRDAALSPNDSTALLVTLGKEL